MYSSHINVFDEHFQVMHWREKITRQCVERLKAFQNPPMLVGQVMEMIMTLIGKRQPSQRLEVKEHYPGKEDQSGRFSTSSTSTRLTQAKKSTKIKIFCIHKGTLLTM